MLYIKKLFIKKSLVTSILGIVLFVGFFLYTTVAQAATLNVSPANITTTVGKIFTVRVFVDTQGQSINAVDGQLTFSNNLVNLVGISKTGIMNLWAQDPTYSNSTGAAAFQGVSLNGYSGSAGTIVTLSFQAKAQGTAIIAVTQDSSSVLLDDGNGTNVLSGTNGASITINAAAVTSTAPSVNSPTSVPTSTPVVATTTTPVFTAYNSPLAPNNFVVVKGTALPNSIITITFDNTAHDGTSTVTENAVVTDSNGQFVFVSDSKTIEGHTYSVIATTTDGQSTQPLILKVKNSIWFTIKVWIIDFAMIKISILFTIVLFIIVLYLLYRIYRLRKMI